MIPWSISGRTKLYSSQRQLKNGILWFSLKPAWTPAARNFDQEHSWTSLLPLWPEKVCGPSHWRMLVTLTPGHGAAGSRKPVLAVSTVLVPCIMGLLYLKISCSSSGPGVRFNSFLLSAHLQYEQGLFELAGESFDRWRVVQYEVWNFALTIKKRARKGKEVEPQVPFWRYEKKPVLEYFSRGTFYLSFVKNTMKTTAL